MRARTHAGTYSLYKCNCVAASNKQHTHTRALVRQWRWLCWWRCVMYVSRWRTPYCQALAQMRANAMHLIHIGLVWVHWATMLDAQHLALVISLVIVGFLESGIDLWNEMVYYKMKVERETLRGNKKKRKSEFDLPFLLLRDAVRASHCAKWISLICSAISLATDGNDEMAMAKSHLFFFSVRFGCMSVC